MNHYSSDKELGTPTWVYLLPAIKHIKDSNNFNVIRQNQDSKSLFNRFKMLPEGIKMQGICMIAASIEGMLRSYLIYNLTNTYKRRPLLVRIAIKILKIFSFQKTQLINNMPFGNLLRAYKLIFGEDLFKSSKMMLTPFNKNDVNYLFEFRNYIIHGNPIYLDYSKAPHSDMYRGKTNRLKKYITDNSLKADHSIPTDEVYHFIEDIIPDKLFDRFYELLRIFLRTDLVDKLIEQRGPFSIIRSDIS